MPTSLPNSAVPSCALCVPCYFVTVPPTWLRQSPSDGGSSPAAAPMRLEQRAKQARRARHRKWNLDPQRRTKPRALEDALPPNQPSALIKRPQRSVQPQEWNCACSSGKHGSATNFLRAARVLAGEAGTHSGGAGAGGAGAGGTGTRPAQQAEVAPVRRVAAATQASRGNAAALVSTGGGVGGSNAATAGVVTVAAARATMEA